jgi:hypothetical protein
MSRKPERWAEQEAALANWIVNAEPQAMAPPRSAWQSVKKQLKMRRAWVDWMAPPELFVNLTCLKMQSLRWAESVEKTVRVVIFKLLMEDTSER